MSLEEALKENTAAMIANTAALAGAKGAAATTTATGAKTTKVDEPKADAKPAKAATPAKAKGPTKDDVIAKATAFLDKDAEDLAERKAFMKTILTKIGAPKASEAKPEFFVQIIEWLDARLEDADFVIEGEDDAMV